MVVVRAAVVGALEPDGHDVVACPLWIDKLEGHALVLDVVREGGTVVQVLHERVAQRLLETRLEGSLEELEEAVPLARDVVDEGLEPEDRRVLVADRAHHVAEGLRRQLNLAHLAWRVDEPIRLDTRGTVAR